MATATLRPTGVTVAGSYWSAGGAGSVLAAISDASDASYGRHQPTSGDQYDHKMEVDLTNFAWPTNTIITNLQMFIRFRSNSTIYPSTSPTSRLRVGGSEIFYEEVKMSNPTSGVIYQINGPLRATKPTSGGAESGTPWTTADVDGVQFMFYTTANGNYDSLDFLDVWASVVYNAPPTVSHDVMSTQARGWNFPASWVYNDIDGNAQYTYQYKIFTSAVVNGGGFDANTSPNVFSTQQYGTEISVTWNPALAEGRYYGAVRAADNVNPNWSGWSMSNEIRVVNRPLGIG